MEGTIFAEQSVSKTLVALGFVQKGTSILAYKVFTSTKLTRRHLFFTQPYPVGIHGTPWHSLISVDESSIHKKSANRSGPFLKGFHMQKPGHFDRGDFKLMCILAIEAGNPSLNGQNFPAVGSTEALKFGQKFLKRLGQLLRLLLHLVQRPLATYNAAVEQKTIIHDNLTPHKSPVVYEAARISGRHVVPRPP